MTQGEDQGRQYGPYGQGFPPAPPAPPGYGDPYGQASWVPPGYGGMPAVEYASWGQRAGALLLDALFTLLLFIPGIALFIAGPLLAYNDNDSDNDAVGAVLLVLGGIAFFAAIGVQLWNQGWRQGAVGWSWGKQIMKIKLVRTTDAQPPGGGVGIGRLFLRGVLGNVTFGVYTVLTYLWPLWDEKKQSLDDKMLNTLVIRAR